MPGEKSDLIRSVAFASYRNINLATARAMAGRNVTPANFFDLSPSALAALTGLRESYFDDNRRRKALDDAAGEVDFAAANGVTITTFDNPSYPGRLRDCDDAPAILYSLGQGFARNYSHIVAIVGTRHCTPYGADFTANLVRDLGTRLDDLLIVSGLAYGVDIAAHRACLANGVPTAAILAHGLSTVYPAEHRSDAVQILRQGGFLMTEYASGAPTHRGNFLARNRIVAGMADAVVVVESDLKGGAIATARIAADYNREVFALPGRVNDPYSRGTNHLIASLKAAMIRHADDLIDAMGWTARSTAGTQQTIDFELSGTQAAIIDFIRANPDATVNDMCVSLGQSYSAISSTLFQMEMEDMIISVPGGRFAVSTALKDI